ncbi:MAG: Gfo/Idh/MocA family protein [Puniceicoccaceae bacterium]
MTSVNKELKIAFIGSGGISGFHASAIEKRPELFNVIATCDINVANARKLADRFGPEVRAFDSMEELYDAVGSDLQGIVSCLPHFLHHPVGEYFLKRGIPVLMEKPVTCNLAELNSLRELETETTFVQAGQMQRFTPEAIWLKDFVQDSERFGEPVSFDLNIWQNIEGYVQGNYDHWILDGKKAGGGICISVGVHPLDLLRFITGQDFTEVTALGRFDPPFTNGAESSCSVLFKMNGGLTGSLHASYKPTRVPYSQRMVLLGERGSLYQNSQEGSYHGPYKAISADPIINDFQDMYGTFEPIDDLVKTAYPNLDPDAFLTQLLHFRNAVFGKRRPTQNSLDINHNTIAVLDAIATSLRSGKTEAVQQLV